MRDRAAYWLARLLIAVFRFLPLRTSLKIGELAGRAAFHVSKQRRVAYINMKHTLGDAMTSAERLRTIRSHFGLMGKNVAEIMSFPKLTRAHVEQHIKIHHLERFQELAKSGRGGVLLAGHFGNWELLQVVAGLLGMPIHLMTGQQKLPRLDALLNQLRETHGAVAVTRGSLGMRALIRALREGKLMGVICDQSAGKTEGLLLPFFGRVTSVPSGPFELAVRTNSSMMTCFMIRREGIEHEVFVGEELRDDTSKPHEERVKLLAEQYIKRIEEFITAHPGQWLWENKRWKYSWDRRIVILSDGKAGHFKQSEVVAEMLADFKEFHGRPGLKFETERIYVEYRSSFHRTALFCLAFLMKPWIQGRLHWLAPFLTGETQKAIEQANADFIIAAGSGLAPVQMLLAQETGAKKIVIMNPPSPYSLTHYDLAIVPAHDGGRVPRRTLRCVIMPSGYRTHDHSSDVKQLQAKLGEGVRPKIGVFLGGAAHHYNLTVSDMEKLCSILKRTVPCAGDFMITTSRRTSAHVESFLKRTLVEQPACRLLVIANEENPPYAAGGMMGFADLLIVTEDSLAMISEAVGTGKRVIVLSLGEGELPEKHYRFHQILSQRGLVTLSGLADLEKNITGLLVKPALPALQREKDALAERLGSLI